jgi:hypothetical protein
MKQTIEFKSEDSPTVLFACGECGHLWSPEIFMGGDVAQAKTMADACCLPVGCSLCGDACSKPYTKCEGCMREGERQRLARVFDNATKCADFTGAIYDPYGERFYASVDDMLDDEELPPYVHPCHEETPRLDLKQILEDAEEQLELEEGFEVQWVAEGDLARAVKAFNDEQLHRVWHPDMKRVIDLKDAR